MKKLIALLLCLALCASFSVTAFAAAAPEKTGSPIKITYDLMYDGITETVDADSDSPLAEYTPDRDDYLFGGWYTEKELVNKLDSSKPVAADSTFFARWVNCDDCVYVDIFLFSDDEYPISSAMVIPGEYLEIEDPGRDDCMFAGWYTDPGFTKKFDFQKPVTENCAVYARFVPYSECITVYLYLDAKDEYYISGAEIPKNEPYIVEAPARENAEFAGWYTDRAYKNRYNGEPLTEDTNFFARWISHESMIYGDVNADGNVDVSDATLIQMYSAGLKISGVFLAAAADVNSDGKLDVVDATLIQKFSAEITDNIGRCGQRVA